jgi:hypothetical protein
VKLFLKGNEKLTSAIAVGVLSILALSIALSPTFNLLVKAQGQNQSQNQTGVSQGVQQELTEIAQKIRDLATQAGLNVTIPEGGNLTARLQEIADSAPLGDFRQQLSEQLSQLGLNGSNIQSLRQEAGSDFGDVVSKLQTLVNNRGN